MTPQIKQRIEQIRRGEVPEGYKKSKVGVVPNEWEETRFKKMFSRLFRKNKENNDNVLTISAQYGLISQRDFFNKDIASEDKSNYFLLHNGEFAYNKSYSNGYPFGALKRLDMYDKGIVSPLYICFSANENNECPDFYVHYFEAGMMNREIQAFAQEGARNHGLLNIAVDDFFNSYLLLPPLPEQEKIAEILSAQDKLIALKEKLVEEKKRQKKHIVHEILSQKIKLQKQDGNKYPQWDTKIIGTYLTSRNTKQIPTEEAPLMAFVADVGVVPKGERYDRSFLVKSNEKEYKRTELNDFIYSSNNLDVGSIGLNNYGSAVISVVYEIFSVNSNAIPIVISEIIQMKGNINKILRYRQGALYGQYRIFAEDFLSVKIDVPSFEEQQEIAKIMLSLEKEIELLQKDLDQEKQKKKALMQLLLTGIVRV
jgi:type I restriction enzyme S subunit